MLRQYENSIDDKRQFTALVKDIFPEEAKNINLILMAYNMGIAQDIQKANLLNNTFAFRYEIVVLCVMNTSIKKNECKEQIKRN